MALSTGSRAPASRRASGKASPSWTAALGAGRGLGRPDGGRGLPLDGDVARLLHPGDEAGDVAAPELSPQRQRAPALRRARQRLGQNPGLGAHGRLLQRLAPGRGQDDGDLGPLRERRGEGGLEDIAPRGVEFGAQAAGELEEALVPEGPVVEDLDELLDLDPGPGRLRRERDDEAVLPARPERGDDARARPGGGAEGLGNGVEEGLVEGQRKDDPGEHGHFLPSRTMTFCMSSQTMRLSSRLPSLRTR